MQTPLLAALLLLGVLALLALAAGWLSVPLRSSQRRAAQRAEIVVRRLLSPAEYEQVERLGYLEVPSRGHPGRSYRIPTRRGPVTVIEHGSAVARLCLQPVQELPGYEVVVVHKLLLEAAEEEYWRRANILGRWMGSRAPATPPRP